MTDSAEPIKEVEDQELNLDQIEDYLTEEGLWLEKQIESEAASKYKKCPVCSAIITSLKVLYEALTETLEQVDEMRQKNIPEKTIASVLDLERSWYDASKSSTLHIFESAHQTALINKAHPELKKVARTKKLNNPNRKKQRIAQRIARKKTRNS